MSVMTQPQDISPKNLKDMNIKRMHRLRDRCVLVEMTASRWNNSAKDTQAKSSVASDFSAQEDMLSFSKRILTPEVLKSVQRHYSRARDLFRVPKEGAKKHTNVRYAVAQWNAGQVLVPVGRVQEMLSEFAAHKSALEAELEGLRGEWDKHVEAAAAASGKLFDRDLIPSFDEFKNSWPMSIKVRQLPEFHPVITLDDHQLKDLATQMYEGNVRDITEALSAGWKRSADNLLRSVQYATAVLANDSDTVRDMNNQSGEKRKSSRAVPVADTLFESLRMQLDTTEQLATDAGDEQLLEAVAESRHLLGDLSADHLRRNPSDRQRVAEAAKRLTTKVKAAVDNTHQEIAEASAEVDPNLAAFG